jgi:hypothetical protein
LAAALSRICLEPRRCRAASGGPEQQQGGGTVQMRLPYEPSLENCEPMFYAKPQPAPPPKDMTGPPAQIYQPPGRDA